MNKLLRRIRKMRKGHRMHRTMTLVVSVITMIIVFVNTFALIVPAVAAEKNAVCGMEQHQHTDDCYEEELICGLQESEGHQHTDSCYTAKSVLYCDVPVHEHDKNWLYNSYL